VFAMSHSKMTLNKIHCLTLPTPFAVGDVNVYIIEAEKLTLIDAGVKTEAAWNQFVLQLKELGYTPHDIQQVVITHHHPDHVGLLDYLPQTIPVYGHRYNKPWLEKNEDFLQRHDQFFKDLFVHLGVEGNLMELTTSLKESLAYSCRRALTHFIKENDYISGLPGWTVLETPGHAQSHIALFHDEERLLLGGDLLIGHISSNPLAEPPMDGGNRPRSLLQYNNSLRKIKALNVSRVFSGHGKEIYEVNDLINERLHKQEKRAKSVLEMLKQGPKTAFQICQLLFPLVFQKEIALTLSETLGQLDFLENKGYILVDKKQTQWLYILN
jgi:glyoxylase-like metal-dependent hydrolase (beta-lactamase superfamily II)